MAPSQPKSTRSGSEAIKSLLSKDKPSGTNYPVRERNLKLALQYDRQDYILTDKPMIKPADDASEADKMAWEKHLNDRTDVGILMIGSMEMTPRISLWNS